MADILVRLQEAAHSALSVSEYIELLADAADEIKALRPEGEAVACDLTPKQRVLAELDRRLANRATPPAPAQVETASLPALGGEVGVKIKPLEWLQANEVAAWADTPFGEYRAYKDGAWKGPRYSASGAGDGRSLASAKAAAQADYESRIRSALATDASTSGEAAAYHQAWVDDWSEKIATPPAKEHRHDD